MDGGVKEKEKVLEFKATVGGQRRKSRVQDGLKPGPLVTCTVQSLMSPGSPIPTLTATAARPSIASVVPVTNQSSVDVQNPTPTTETFSDVNLTPTGEFDDFTAMLQSAYPPSDPLPWDLLCDASGMHSHNAAQSPPVGMSLLEPDALSLFQSPDGNPGLLSNNSKSNSNTEDGDDCMTPVDSMQLAPQAKVQTSSSSIDSSLVQYYMHHVISVLFPRVREDTRAELHKMIVEDQLLHSTTSLHALAVRKQGLAYLRVSPNVNTEHEVQGWRAGALTELKEAVRAGGSTENGTLQSCESVSLSMLQMLLIMARSTIASIDTLLMLSIDLPRPKRR